MRQVNKGKRASLPRSCHNENYQNPLAFSIYSIMQWIIVVLPLLCQISVRVGNSEFPTYGPNHSIQILGSYGCKDLDLVKKVYQILMVLV